MAYGRPQTHAIAATTRAGAESHAIVAHEHTLPVRIAAVVAITSPHVGHERHLGRSHCTFTTLRQVSHRFGEGQGRPTQDSDKYDHRKAVVAEETAQRAERHPNVRRRRINGAFRLRELLPEVRDLRVVAIGARSKDAVGEGREVSEIIEKV